MDTTAELMRDKNHEEYLGASSVGWLRFLMDYDLIKLSEFMIFLKLPQGTLKIVARDYEDKFTEQYKEYIQELENEIAYRRAF